MSDWPKHPNGKNKKVGEMTAEERKAVFSQAVQKVKKDFEDPRWHVAVSKILKD